MRTISLYNNTNHNNNNIAICFLLIVYFDKEMDLTINTTNCKMRWSGNHVYDGQLETRYFSVPGQLAKNTASYKVCKIEYTSSIFIGREVRTEIRGEHALSLISTHGNIEINAAINISGSTFDEAGMSGAKTSIGGYFKQKGDGLDSGRI